MSGIALSGIFSGLDTNTMITQLMNIERTNYNKLDARKTDYTNEQGLFRTINTKLSTLRDAAFDLTMSYNFKLTSAKSSDEKVLTLTADSGAATGTYAVNVTQLAQSHIIRTDTIALDGNKLTGLIGNNITIGGKSITVSGGSAATPTNKDVLYSLKDAINGAKAGVKASIVQTDDTHATLVLTTEKSGLGNAMVYGAGSGSQIGIAGDTTTLQTLGLFNSDGTIKNEVQAAQDAKITINGIDITSSSNTIQNAIENVTLTLVGKGDSTVTVATDADKVADKVQAFVDAYNAVIDAINSARNYQDADKRNPLQADSTLNSLQSQLSTWFNAQVGADQGAGAATSSFDYRYLFQVGLEVDKDATNADEMTGKISFDRDKFKSALADNPDAVYQLFAYNGTADNKTSGIAQLFNTNLNSWTSSVDGIIKSKLDGYDSEISFISDQMAQMDVRLQMKEDALRKQFTDMETALAGLQNQQSWLSSQLNALYA
jgi:flagellar hook-associated protein 2